MVRHARPAVAGDPAGAVRIDLNADVGESFGRWTLGDDAALIPLLSSANIACGFHAGDPATLRRTCAMTVDHGVAIGAQVSYPDLAGFGRRFVDVAPDDLLADVVYQVGALDGLARSVGGRVGFVKPHGALYHAMSTSTAQAAAVARAVSAIDANLTVVAFPGSHLIQACTEVGVAVVLEGFADRAYASDGTLVSRSVPGAVLAQPDEVADQAARLARSGKIATLCLHGDTPGAADLARAVRQRCERDGITVAAFT